MNAELLIFEVAGSKFSVPLDKVEEVVPIGAITEVPQAPPFLLGLTSVRGKVMAVIDASKRFRIGPALNAHFMICNVRGNLTAIAIDRPIIAGAVSVRELAAEELKNIKVKSKVEDKFIIGGFELLDKSESGDRPSGTHFLEVNPDLFVSAEMASKIGEA